jgi:OOP family OmpA-OmpF porin
MTHIKTVALAGCLVLAFTAAATAEEHPTWTLTGGLVYADADRDGRQADDGYGFMLGFGRYLGPRLSIDLEYDSYDFELSEGGDVDIDNISLMGRYHFDVSSRARPYIGLGTGQADHKSPRGNGDDHIIQAAGGFHYALGERVNLRSELRYRYDSDNSTGVGAADGFSDWLVTVGLQVALGQAGKPTPPAASEPVETVRDGDGDGVADAADRCPRTPQGASVDANGCPLDSDGDGVPDYRDDCPATPKGKVVGANGCQHELLVELPGVYFDFDRYSLKTEAVEVLTEVVANLNEHDLIHISVEGHTDWTGTEAYNQKLSDQRAGAVVEFLRRHGVSESRLSWVGYGEAQPVASNDTEQGRARNRRVELRIVD